MQKQKGVNLNKLDLQKELFHCVSTDRNSEKRSLRRNVFWRSPRTAVNVQRQQGEGERYKEKCRKTAAQAKLFKLLSVSPMLVHQEWGLTHKNTPNYRNKVLYNPDHFTRGKGGPLHNSQKMTALAGTTVNRGQERWWEWRSHFPQVTHSVQDERMPGSLCQKENKAETRSIYSPDMQTVLQQHDHDQHDAYTLLLGQ